ncbi:hypothetical protein [Microbacterium maritypicum]|uniref:ABC transporter permease n=1 Tax=Microbacterium maritypicum TaxID=33918 RepID=A0A4Y4B4W7_MICMQ|nr:hypothetical protein [Microbacterium liquefaciens]GEC75528.1 hypothetical protein MLI01_16730 [Microbacterium liquefaciens]GGV63930.1 hypothetical protein GCM10010213_29030 [Microbacterium liquefaciens]
MYQFLRLEAARNLRSNWVQSLVVAFLSMLAGSAVVLGGAAELASVAAQQQTLRDNGTEIWVVKSSDPFSVAACNELQGVDGIADAGAAVNRWQATLEGLPGIVLSVVDATPGYVRIMWGTGSNNGRNDSGVRSVSGVSIGSAIAERTGSRPGAPLVLSPVSESEALRGIGERTRVRIGAVLPSTSRLANGNQLLVLEVAPAGMTSECLVQPHLGSWSSVERYLTSQFGSQASITALSLDDSQSPSPQERMHARTTAWTPALVGLMLLVVVCVLQLGRRTEWALYRVAGADRLSLLQMLVVETAATVWMPYAAGVLISALCFGPLPLPIAGDVNVALGVANDVFRAALLLALSPAVLFLVLERPGGPLLWLKGR